MSCNPAIGGLGKGHLVREIDALDGLMGRRRRSRRHPVPDAQPSQGPGGARPARPGRPQALSRARCRRRSRRSRNLDVIEGEVDDLHRRGTAGSPASAWSTAASLSRRRGRADDRHVPARADPSRREELAGRPGRRGAGARPVAIASSRLGLPLGRLKTGTPPRLDGRTIDWAALEMQPGDDPPEPFSALTDRDHDAADRCAGSPAPRRRPTRSSAPISIARRCIPAQIDEPGPRYCPSIEDKVVRFADRDGHQIFLEPEGLDDATVYPNGISTSLPEDVQLAMLRDDSGAGARRDDPARLCDRI